MGEKLNKRIVVALIATILFIGIKNPVNADTNLWGPIDSSFYQINNQTWQTDENGNTPDLYSVWLNGNPYYSNLANRSFYPIPSYGFFDVTLQHMATSQLGNKTNSNVSSYQRLKENGILAFMFDFNNISAFAHLTSVQIDYSIGGQSNFSGVWIDCDYLTFENMNYVVIYHVLSGNEMDQNNIVYKFRFNYAETLREDVDYFNFYSLHCWPCTPSSSNVRQLIMLNRICKLLSSLELSGATVDLSKIEQLLTTISTTDIDIEENLSKCLLELEKISAALYDKTDNISWLQKIYNAVIGSDTQPSPTEESLNNATEELKKANQAINKSVFNDNLDFNKLVLPTFDGNKFQFLKQRIEATYTSFVNSNVQIALMLLLPLALFVLSVFLRR